MDEHLLARLNSIDSRMESIEGSVSKIFQMIGELSGKVACQTNGRFGLLVRCVVLPLIFIVGALVGIKLWF